MVPFIMPDDPAEQGIFFFYEGVGQCLGDEQRFAHWLQHVIISERKTMGHIQVIFMTDNTLLELNRTYLGHDYFTDIITFPLEDDPISAELYISIDRVRDNAVHLSVPAEEELARVMVHGILHLCGYGDKKSSEKQIMREREGQYLELLYKEK